MLHSHTQVVILEAFGIFDRLLSNKDLALG